VSRSVEAAAAKRAFGWGDNTAGVVQLGRPLSTLERRGLRVTHLDHTTIRGYRPMRASADRARFYQNRLTGLFIAGDEGAGLAKRRTVTSLVVFYCDTQAVVFELNHSFTF
jgi:hypothetical protein